MHLHRYRTAVHWDGTTGGGYEAYDRHHRAAADPAEGALSLSADPSFRGDPALLNPEQLVVLAASSCQLLSFLAIAARARFDVVSYEDDAEGEMPDPPTDAGRPWIERIRLRPRIRIRGPEKLEQVQRLVALAHQECFIANSLRSEITVDATITFDGRAAE